MKKTTIIMLTALILFILSSCFNETTSHTTEDFKLRSDVWYTLVDDQVFKFQNAEIYRATPMSNGSTYMITYHPICKNCNENGPMEMTGVGVTTPITKTYYCNSCSTTTYVRFKLEY